MKFDFETLLRLLPMVGPAVAATAEFAERFKALIGPLDEDEQDALKEALEDVRADNDEGHRRLQKKLAAAAERE